MAGTPHFGWPAIVVKDEPLAQAVTEAVQPALDNSEILSAILALTDLIRQSQSVQAPVNLPPQITVETAPIDLSSLGQFPTSIQIAQALAAVLPDTPDFTQAFTDLAAALKQIDRKVTIGSGGGGSFDGVLRNSSGPITKTNPLYVDSTADDSGRHTTQHAGTDGGTVTLVAGERLASVSVFADGADSSFTVDGGPAITVRAGYSVTWNPAQDDLQGIIIELGPALDYFIEGSI